MADINISNPKGRDAVVNLESVASVDPIRWLDDSGRQASSSRFVKATLDHGIDALLAKHKSLQGVGEAILAGDPEIDLNNTGRSLKDTARVFVDKHGGIVRNVRFWEVIKNPDGSERERRPRQLAEQNVSTDTPLKWSGVFVPKQDAVRRFVFTGKAQLQHVNGLTYDFLYSMAKELEARNCLMLLGSGPKSNQPLVLRRGGTPYRGFLEGRTEGEKYCLLLHFSNLELKSVPPSESAETPATATKKNAASKKATSEPDAGSTAARDSADAKVSTTKPAKKTSAKRSGTKGGADAEVEIAGSDARAAKVSAKTKAAKKTATKKKTAPKPSTVADAVADADGAAPTKKPTAKKTAKRKPAKKKPAKKSPKKATE